MNKLVLYLVRKRLGLKKFELFRFIGQKSKTVYFFADQRIVKVYRGGKEVPSRVSLNWLISDNCKIERVVGADLKEYLPGGFYKCKNLFNKKESFS